MIEVKNLTKRYGDKVAINDISFTVNSGEVVGFLGPNGAGKTTTMNIITGYLSYTDGTVMVGGYNTMNNPIMVKRQIGYLPEQPPLYTEMSVYEYLDFIFRLKKVKYNKKSHINEICEKTRITHVRDRIIKNLSKGYRQRVGLAQALIGNPPILVLDEPSIGLDPIQIMEMRILIQELGKQHTVILSSHILSEIQAVCKRIIIIHQGEIVADGEPNIIARSITGSQKILIRTAGPPNEVFEALLVLPCVQSVESLGIQENNTFDFSLEPLNGMDIRGDIFSLMSLKNWPLLSMHSNELSLEDIFLRLTAEPVVMIRENWKVPFKIESKEQLKDEKPERGELSY